MGAFPARSVVLVPFPFSDLSRAKLRPSVVLADAGRGDRILCQITSKPYGDQLAVVLDHDSLRHGTLRSLSFARPGKLFTASAELIVRRIGTLAAERHDRIVEAAVELLYEGTEGD